MKELEDYNWFPRLFRNFQTDFIGFIVARFHVYGVFIAYLKTLPLARLPMTDLCSGSGEPAVSIYRKSNCFSSLRLTDKFPNEITIKDDYVHHETKSTDVLKMEFQAGNCYTMFNSFHHFTKKEQLIIVERIGSSGATAFIVEVLEPSVFCFLKIAFATTVGCIVLTPFIQPFSLKRLFFTYIVPINLFTIAFDGIVSVLKSSTVEQYQALFAKHKSSMKIFRLQNGWTPLIVLEITGTP